MSKKKAVETDMFNCFFLPRIWIMLTVVMYRNKKRATYSSFNTFS